MSTSKQTWLQDPDLFMAMDDLELAAKAVVEGAIHGLHRSPYIGFSVEFDSHREYQFGDDLRHVNWNLWAKTDDLYIKEFQSDTNLNLYLLMDTSGSMRAENGMSMKWRYAARAAAALTYLSLGSRDATGCYLLGSRVDDCVTPKIKPGQFVEILAMMEGVNPEGEANLANAMHEVTELVKRKGIVILFSDMYDNEEKTFGYLCDLKNMGHEVILMHMVDPWETELPEKGHFEFTDLEDGTKLRANSAVVKKAYKQIYSDWQKDLRRCCINTGINWVTVNTREPLKEVIIDYLIKRARLY